MLNSRGNGLIHCRFVRRTSDLHHAVRCREPGRGVYIIGMSVEYVITRPLVIGMSRTSHQSVCCSVTSAEKLECLCLRQALSSWYCFPALLTGLSAAVCPDRPAIPRNNPPDCRVCPFVLYLITTREQCKIEICESDVTQLRRTIWACEFLFSGQAECAMPTKVPCGLKHGSKGKLDAIYCV